MPVLLKGHGNEADFLRFLQKSVPHESRTLPFEPFRFWLRIRGDIRNRKTTTRLAESESRLMNFWKKNSCVSESGSRCLIKLFRLLCACCCRHPLFQLCWRSVVGIPAFALSMLLATPLPCWYSWGGFDCSLHTSCYEHLTVAGVPFVSGVFTVVGITSFPNVSNVAQCWCPCCYWQSCCCSVLLLAPMLSLVVAMINKYKHIYNLYDILYTKWKRWNAQPKKLHQRKNDSESPTHWVGESMTENFSKNSPVPRKLLFELHSRK